ncbi:uncharacterized, partial [Tachysurus ichikawai]
CHGLMMISSMFSTDEWLLQLEIGWRVKPQRA